MSENKKTILFLFNQLLSETQMGGGEVRGLKILELFNKDPEYSVQVMLPKNTIKKINADKIYYVGENFIENFIYAKNLQWNPFMIFILYVIRTLESSKHINKIDSDVVYSTGDFFCDTIPAVSLKLFRRKIKWVCCVHHINESPFIRKKVRLLNSIVSYISQRVSFLMIRFWCDQVFSINGIVKKYLKKYGICDSEIFVVGNGQDTRAMDVLREKNKDIKKENKICFYSRVNPSKGALDLPEILSGVIKKHPNIKIQIIGSIESEMRQKLNKEFTELGFINNVDILGFVENTEEAHEKTLSARTVIFPTYEEGWGLAIFEMLLLKNPVVVYKLPIFEDLFKGNILSAEVGNKDEFIEKILFSLDTANERKVSEKVEKCYQIAKKYDWVDVFNSERQRIQLLL